MEQDDSSTPPKSDNNQLISNILPNQDSCDNSPLVFLPKESTPPSRFTKIFNPFEAHLIEKLHLPTFSPNVFAPVSTPKNKFKWTIDEVSKLRPANIDEATLSQHAFETDPHIESLVQEKIRRFFDDKVIVPSPMQHTTPASPLFKPSPVSSTVSNKLCDNSAQTILTLPPVLPPELEELLKPFCTYTQNQQKAHDEVDSNSSFYRRLFHEPSNCDEQYERSPTPSLSPIHRFTKISGNIANFGTPDGQQMPPSPLISPIGASFVKEGCISACRLDFSGHMSVDNSISVVPDNDKSLNNSESSNNSINLQTNINSDETTNWDMEYSNIFVKKLQSDNVDSPELFSSSSSDTPHSKIFPSQRKRLSDSFKDKENIDIDMKCDQSGSIIKRSKSRLTTNSQNSASYSTDAGYITGGTSRFLAEKSSFEYQEKVFFASTPTKN